MTSGAATALVPTTVFHARHFVTSELRHCALILLAMTSNVSPYMVKYELIFILIGILINSCRHYLY